MIDSNETLAVAVLGVGTMGRAIATNLIKAGFRTTVWDRSPTAVASLEGLGAVPATDPANAVRGAGLVISMLPDAEATTSVAVERGMLAALSPGAVWAQMATVGPQATSALATRVAAQRPDIGFVDAPVSGSKGPAEAGQLIILASGPEHARSRIEAVFGPLGRRTLWLGEAGRGSRLKLVLNAWLAFLMEGLVETAALADRLGVTHDEFIDALQGGPLATGLAAAKLHKLDAGDLDAEFSLQWALKDVDLALADSGDGRLPVLSALSDQWRDAVAKGLGPLDVSAARLALEEHAPR